MSGYSAPKISTKIYSELITIPKNCCLGFKPHGSFFDIQALIKHLAFILVNLIKHFKAFKIFEINLAENFIFLDIFVYPKPGIQRIISVVSHHKITVLRHLVRTIIAYRLILYKIVI